MRLKCGHPAVPSNLIMVGKNGNRRQCRACILVQNYERDSNRWGRSPITLPKVSIQCRSA